MNLVHDFIPTPEDLANYERHSHRSQGPSAGAAASAAASAAAAANANADAESHTASTGDPAQQTAAAMAASAAATAAASYTPYAFPGAGLGAGGWGMPAILPPRAPLAPHLISAAGLKDLKIPRRPALLDRWLCEGDLGYIFAPRGVGKTWMALALPWAISRGCALGLWEAGIQYDPVTGLPSLAPREPMPVLYVDGEMPLELTQYRAAGLQMEHARVDYLHHENLFNAEGSSLNIGELRDREAITTLLVEKGYKVLILDNLSSLASGIDENKGTDYEPISHWLLELRRRRITVIVIHHAGRNGFMRGHTKREDACSWILELRDAKQDGDTGAKFVSHFAKPSRNTGEPLPDLLWHFTSDAEGRTHIACELSVICDYEQFIQHVLDGVTNQKDIAEMMDKNKGTISKWARKALQENRLSGSASKLLPPKPAAGPRAKIRVHASDDSYDDGDDE